MVIKSRTKPQPGKVTRRDEHFAEQLRTRIWQETPDAENPYLSTTSRCHGYEITDLMQNCSYTDIVYLIFRGELPDKSERQLLTQLQICLINPGPRHPATRAAIYAGVGKSNPSHILPIALSVLGGTHLGGAEVEQAMRFLRKASRKSVELVIQENITPYIKQYPPTEGDWHPVPGFGQLYGSIDPLANKYALRLSTLPASGNCMAWAKTFTDAISQFNLGWLMPGLAAAAFNDLGFLPRAGAGLYQLLSAPGLLAHGLEYANKPFNSVSFPSDEHYFIENNDEKATTLG